MKCKTHGKTLLETTAYKSEGELTPDAIALGILRDFPHSIHYDYALQPNEWFKVPEQILYCADCESQARVARGMARISN